MKVVFSRAVGAVALIALVALLVAGCGGGGSSSSSSSSTSTTAESGNPTEPAESTEPTESDRTAAMEGESPSTSWPSVGNDVGGTRHSTASQVTTENVGELKPAYLEMLEPAGSVGSGSENNPVESEGVIYASSSSENPVLGAYDAGTGKMLWQISAKELGIPKEEPNIGTRGVAIGDGLVYVEEPGGSSSRSIRRPAKMSGNRSSTPSTSTPTRSRPRSIGTASSTSASPAATSSAACAAS